jgi:hypothetical protein
MPKPVGNVIKNHITITNTFPKVQRPAIAIRAIANSVSLARRKSKLQTRVPLSAVNSVQRPSLANSEKVGNKFASGPHFRDNVFVPGGSPVRPDRYYRGGKGVQHAMRSNARWADLASQLRTKAMRAGYSDSYATNYAAGEVRRLRSKQAEGILKLRAKGAAARKEAKSFSYR